RAGDCALLPRVRCRPPRPTIQSLRGKTVSIAIAIGIEHEFGVVNWPALPHRRRRGRRELSPHPLCRIVDLRTLWMAALGHRTAPVHGDRLVMGPSSESLYIRTHSCARG